LRATGLAVIGPAPGSALVLLAVGGARVRGGGRPEWCGFLLVESRSLRAIDPKVRHATDRDSVLLVAPKAPGIVALQESDPDELTKEEKCYAQHRAKEFKLFLREIDGSVPANLDVHVILDNLSTHKTPEIRRWLAKHPRFQLHFTPTHASWLNLVERFFGLLTEHALRRGSHKNTRELRTAIQDYLDAHNDEPKPFRWTKTADEILASIARFATRASVAHPGEGS
jgi:transposase